MLRPVPARADAARTRREEFSFGENPA